MHRFLLLTLLLLLPACTREEPAPASPTPASERLPKGEEPGPSAAVPTPAPAPLKLEDRVYDAALEAPVRQKAQELQAIRPEDVGHLPPDAKPVALVRAAAEGEGTGPIYGSGPYTLDSNLRKAVVHAGLAQPGQLTLVRVTVVKHPGDHPSIPQHGVKPHKWGQYHASYTLEPIPTP